MAASGIFIVAGWRSKHPPTAAHGRPGLPFDPLWGETEIDIGGSQAHTDVDAALRLALKRLVPVMARQSVQADIASPSGLLVRMRSAVLADLLEDFLAAAIHSAPASRLLLTAAIHGGWVDINVTDDIPGADPAVRRGSVSRLAERMAMRGGGLEVDVRPAEGTTMTLRLAAVATERTDQNEQSQPEPGPRLSGSIGGSSVRSIDPLHPTA